MWAAKAITSACGVEVVPLTEGHYLTFVAHFLFLFLLRQQSVRGGVYLLIVETRE